MRVDQTGEKGGISEINDLDARRASDLCADFDDDVAFDQDFAGRGDAAGFNIKQTRGV